MNLTFVDTSVLIAAARGNDEVAASAMQILDDPDRKFASSIFVKLETMPKSVFYKQRPENEFYEEFFEAVVNWATVNDELTDSAFAEACKVGLSAMDSLHVAAAHELDCDELVTAEGPTKPLHQTTLVRVVSIRTGSTESAS